MCNNVDFTRWIGGLAGGRNVSVPLYVTAVFHPNANPKLKAFSPVQVATVVKGRRKCPLVKEVSGPGQDLHTGNMKLTTLPGATGPLIAFLYSVLTACQGVKV